MPIDEFHEQVAAVALRAAGHGFALGGGNALIAHGVIARPTQDATCSATRNAAWPQPPTRLRRR